jgi:hypothetical protein
MAKKAYSLYFGCTKGDEYKNQLADHELNATHMLQHMCNKTKAVDWQKTGFVFFNPNDLDRAY